MIEIRSYRRVFDLERRIYRVDRLRLNPGGVPVRGVVYLLVIVLADLIATRLPLVGLALRAMPWYLRDLLLPGVTAAVLSVIRVDGRPFHLAAHALVRARRAARRPLGRRREGGPGTRWHPGEILFLPNGADSRMRNLRYTGPGGVLIGLQHERAVDAPRVLRRRSAALVVRELPAARRLVRGQVLEVGANARLHVRATAARTVGRR